MGRRAGRPRKVASCALAATLSLFARAAAPEHGHAVLRTESAVATGRTLSGPTRDPGAAVAWASVLGPVTVENLNTGARASVRLYLSDGSIDRQAMSAFLAVASDSPGDLAPLEPRLLQLTMKAAYHFKSNAVVIISAYRDARRNASGGKHATGEALDFQLRGVHSPLLAAYLRTLPRAGVGIYTHPRTQYVHLDVRDQSFHWLDASPPRKIWREAPLADSKRAARDSAYTSSSDLPD